MPILGTLRRPPAPTCEDCWDEDTQSPFTDGRAANVAVKRSKSSEFDPKSAAEKKSHDGSDSGYSSKAGTSDDMSTTPIKKGVDLKLNTKIERERHPYTYAPARPEDGRTSSPTKAKAVKIEHSAKPPQQRYPPSMYPAYDQYQFPYDYEREIQRPATAMERQSQKVAKSPAPKVKKEEPETRPTNSRRSSSSSRSRPQSMYGAFPYGAPTPADYAMYPASAAPWQMPSNYQYNPYPYGHPPPSSAVYAPSPGYFEPSPMPFSRGQDPFYPDAGARGYDEPAPRQKTSKKEALTQKTSSREARQRSSTKSKPSAEADRAAMPPPSLPRPTLPRKAPTDYPNIASRRDSVLIDDDESLELRNTVRRERNSSSSRPPSSYRRVVPEAESYHRPGPRKSVSYSTSTGTVQVASSQQRDMPRRRTDPVEKSRPLEQQLADVENYVARRREIDAEAPVKPKKSPEFESEDLDPRIRNRRSYAFEGIGNYFGDRASSGEFEFDDFIQPPKRKDLSLDQYNTPANRTSMKPLTAESLQIIEKQSAAISDVESIRSKQSSSRDSATGRTRAGTNLTAGSGTNIMMDGVSLNIPANYLEPLNIMLNNVQLSINPNTSAPREDERVRDLKRIERAPSEVSQSSRRSLTNESVASLAKEQQALARSKHSGYSSKRSSRAVSTTRPEKHRGEVRSIDYSVSDYPESYYLGEYI